MCPYLYVFGYPFSGYGIMVALGFLCCIAYCLIRYKKNREIDPATVIFLGLWTVLGVFVGSHILYGITNLDNIITILTHADEFFENFWVGLSLLGSQIGGMVFYGGLIGGAIAALIYLKTTKKDVGLYCDLLVPCIPLFHFFGRIGCFLGGCCYGIEFPIGFTYTNSLSEAANGVCRLPLPLIEAFFNLLIFILLAVLHSKNTIRKGSLWLAYAFTYPVVRFIDEFFRGDEIRGFWGPLSTSQWISLGIFALALIYFIICKARGIKFINKAPLLGEAQR